MKSLLFILTTTFVFLTGCQNEQSTPPQGIQTISSSSAETFIIRSDNSTWAAGIIWPTIFLNYYSGTFTQSIAAEGFNIHLKSDGTLWARGENGSGQLGQGDYTSRTDLNLVQIGSDTNWKSVTTDGINSVYAIKNDANQSLWSWGYNGSGELGIGNTSSQNTPVEVNTTDHNWSTILAKQATCYGIKNDGTLWAWGNNAYGQLADTTTTNNANPQQIGASTFQSMATDGFSAIALDTNGSLWAWGANNSGQLGIGDTVDKASPIQIVDTDWAKIFFVSNGTISSLFSNGYAIKTNGTLWSWGNNTYGQLGVGTKSSLPTTSPMQINSDTNWVDIATTINPVLGQISVIALKSNGTLWAWGDNSTGVLGLNDQTERLTPTQIATDSDWTGIISTTAGVFFATKTDGSVWAWGYNQYGQLGVGYDSLENGYVVKQPTRVQLY